MKDYFQKRDFDADLANLEAGQVIQFKFPGLIDSRINFLSGFLARYLRRHNLGFLSEMVLVLVKEVTSNCSKANAKRIFFEENGWEITNKSEYNLHIEKYSQQVLRTWEDWAKEHQDSEYYIHIFMQEKNDAFRIRIENNIQVVAAEAERIKSKFTSFKKFKDINDAFSSIRDESEGAGLGIFFSLSLLQNAGIPIENFRIHSEKGKTIHDISIPLTLATPEFASAFYNQIQKEIEELPSFPQNISYLLDLCQSENSSVHMIASQVSKDPSLTAQVLKLVNSAGYMSRNRNPSLEDAVKIIGLKVLKNILMVTGARNVISDRYRLRDLETIWEDSNRVSYFARRLAEGKGNRLVESATVTGLLFELGKIILLSLKPDVMKNIAGMIANKRVRSAAILEETLLGISDAEIGAFMSDKWNFPEDIVAGIKYQHRPLQAPENHTDLVKVIYLASAIHQASMGHLDYWYLESEVLKEFGINSPDDFQTRVSQYEEGYKMNG